MNRPKPTRPWWLWVLVAIVAVFAVGALAGGGDDARLSSSDGPAGDPARPAVTETTSGAQAVASTVDEPTATLSDARAAADAGRYSKAVAIARAVGPGAHLAIRRRIANRVARRALDAVRAGKRGRARWLLAQARHYPTTAATQHARADYTAAEARAAARRIQIRVAAAQRREQRAAARAATRAATQQAAEAPSTSDCDPSYRGACLNPDSADYDCEGGSGNGPDYTGTVQVVGDDHFDLDRDGDGTGCDG